jgi:hypothetical protein
MSAIHVASAANEVAQALPSTATVSVSRHGIQAIETLNLEAQTESASQVTWSRTFSGMEILTNPTLHYRTVSKVTLTTDQRDAMTGNLKDFKKWREHVRLASDPIANAASNLNVTVNNASMSITPKVDHRIVTSFYPDEREVSHQRKHYGLNQLDQYAESEARVFEQVSVDDVEKQHNSNSLRENFPCTVYSGAAGAYSVVDEKDFVPVIRLTTAEASTPSAGAANDRSVVRVTVKSNGVVLGYGVQLSAASNGTTQPTVAAGTYYLTIQNATATGAESINKDINPDDLDFVIEKGDAAATTFTPIAGSCKLEMQRGTVGAEVEGGDVSTANKFYQLPWTANADLDYAFVHDVYQPLNHPYFRDNVMRDNTLVNVRYFDCQLTIGDANRLVEIACIENGAQNNKAINYTTSLLLKSDDEIATGVVSKGLSPTLIFDLVTPSVPLPTISDKVISTYHTIRSSSRNLVNGVKPLSGMQSGNIQLAQVPDMIYVFIRSSKDEAKASSAQANVVPTRLGVVTNLRVRTPQNAAFLINMDQESLYQMACRNGSKQSRSAFMSSLGSVIAIDPEKDLGGYTNGVLVPFTFEVVADFSLPMRSVNDETESLVRGCDLKGAGKISAFDSTANENWTMFVVCELNGHLYLMSDGTGKQTKSNLTVTEVADAVADGIHHPSTFPGSRTSKMDAGILGELGRGPGEADDGVRAALRQ